MVTCQIGFCPMLELIINSSKLKWILKLKEEEIRKINVWIRFHLSMKGKEKHHQNSILFNALISILENILTQSTWVRCDGESLTFLLQNESATNFFFVLLLLDELFADLFSPVVSFGEPIKLLKFIKKPISVWTKKKCYKLLKWMRTIWKWRYIIEWKKLKRNLKCQQEKKHI